MLSYLKRSRRKIADRANGMVANTPKGAVPFLMQSEGSPAGRGSIGTDTRAKGLQKSAKHSGNGKAMQTTERIERRGRLSRRKHGENWHGLARVMMQMNAMGTGMKKSCRMVRINLNDALEVRSWGRWPLGQS